MIKNMLVGFSLIASLAGLFTEHGERYILYAIYMLILVTILQRKEKNE